MTMTTKLAIFDEYKYRYFKASKGEKRDILNHICFVTKIHRKAAIRKFSSLQFEDPLTKGVRGRKTIYTFDTTLALKKLWGLASECCGELLFPMIPEYIFKLKSCNEWSFNDETTNKLLLMKEATIKRRIANFTREKTSRKGLSATRPSNLKVIVPIFTGPWHLKPAGYGQLDTVAHCGSTLLGDYVFTLNFTDVKTSWSELRAQWNKGQYVTRESLEEIRKRLPFPLLGIHPDTGSEFINWSVIRYSQENRIEMTRSRPSHKNDNQYIEERNGHIVRKFVGYGRLDKREAVSVLNNLYNSLSLYLNHFIATRKCVAKTRIGAKYVRAYDKPKTPYERVMEEETISQIEKDNLKKIHDSLNLFELKCRIDKLKEEIYLFQRRLETHTDLNQISVTVSNDL
jgi:hypothetical protein